MGNERTNCQENRFMVHTICLSRAPVHSFPMNPEKRHPILNEYYYTSGFFLTCNCNVACTVLYLKEINAQWDMIVLQYLSVYSVFNF